MNRFEKYRGHGFKNTRTAYTDGEVVTRSGLAYTPADMERMTAQGIPVHTTDVNTRFYDGDDRNDFFVTSDRIRQNDINDLWEGDMDIRERARAAHKESKKSKK